MPNVTLRFDLEKETKGAVRYAEQTEGALAEPTIGTLYIRKSALARMGHTQIPSVVKLTLETAG